MTHLAPSPARDADKRLLAALAGLGDLYGPLVVALAAAVLTDTATVVDRLKEDSAPVIREHLHAGIQVEVDRWGRGADGPLLGQLIGSTLDRCQPCRDELLACVAEHPPTTARLIELACLAIQHEYGAMPPRFLEPAAPHTLVSIAFRILARAGSCEHGGGAEQMWATAATMAPGDRVAAADTALNLLIGALSR